jgi:hypothetical protein
MMMSGVGVGAGVGKSDRAPPRKRKESMDDQQPQFLRKAYYMIENCNPDIGRSVHL